jgi:two-component system sensor histidine kinase CpxA
MTRLYWKIFLAFWAVIILTVAVTITVNSIVFRDKADSTRIDELRGSLEGLSAQAQKALDEGGVQGLRGWLTRRQGMLPFTPILIISSEGQELLDRPVPRQLRSSESRFGIDGPARPKPGRMSRLQVHEIQDQAGRSFRIVVPRLKPRLGGWSIRPEARAMFPLFLVLLSGAACLLLARYLTRPIRAFRAAGKRITDGDLTARVGPSIARRRDEFGDLAVDFDRMAERIEELLESQKQLLRDVSHELRSPLARLQAAAGLIRQKSDPTVGPELARIEQETENLNELIGQILNFVRLEGLTEIERQTTNLVDLITDIRDDAMYESSASGKSIVVEGNESVDVDVDEPLIYRAIENVVRNAVRHSNQRTEIMIAGSAPGQVKISVKDDGPGIDPGHADKIFEPFFTQPSPDGNAGAGIGLAIARRAVELHGGKISARNAPGGGLIVEITL